MEKNNSWITKYENCFYSERLITKLISLSEKTKNRINLLEIKKAIYYAKKYHASQLRQTGEPYYSHPIEVAYMASDYLFRTDIVVTSILHDTIEDTDLTFKMIKIIFSEKIANQVMDLTRIKDGNKISSAEMVNSLWLQKKYDLLFIKEMDRLHNIRTIEVKSPEKATKIIKETLGTFLVLATFLGLKDVEEELRLLCSRFLAPHKTYLQNKRFLGGGFSLPALTSRNVLTHKKNQ